jgi:NitT/TauT family transport system permease protein
MTSSALALPRPAWPPAFVTEHIVPVVVVVAILIVLWYLAAILMNAAQVRDAFERNEIKYTLSDVIAGTLSAERPLVPAPHQVVETFDDRLRLSA